MAYKIQGICISASNSREYNLVKSMILELSPDTKLINFEDVLKDIDLLESCDFIFTIGGDGSVAWLVGKFYGTFWSVEKLKPIVPVVRPESVGYLKQLDLSNPKFKKGFNRILAGDFTVQNRTILKTKINNTSYVSVNEIFLVTTPHLGKFSVFINHVDDRYHLLTSTMADGAMIVTSLGSTGWALSYGGQISLDEDALELIFAGGIHSSANFTLPRTPIKLSLKLKNSIISDDTKYAYNARRTELGMPLDNDPVQTLDMLYGSRVIIDGKVIAFGVNEIEIDSSDSIPFVFLFRETVVDKARKLTKQPRVK